MGPLYRFEPGMDDGGDGAADGRLQPIDLLLQQGAPDELAALRQRVADDPLLALEVADTVALVEAFRLVEVTPSARYAAGLQDLVRRAELRLSPRRSTPRVRDLLWVAAAAVLTWGALAWAAPGAHRAAAGAVQPEWAVVADAGVASVASPLAPSPAPPVEVASAPRTYLAQELEHSLQQMRRRLEVESTPRLRAEFDSALQGPADPLSGWLDPRNALVALRLDHELRADVLVREQALRRAGAMEGADGRVQQLADGIAAALSASLGGDASAERGAATVPAVALAVRALLAAGALPARDAALAAGTDWLAARLPVAAGPDLVEGLGALVEVAAAAGHHFALVAQLGDRLLDEVLRVDQDTWGRRLPELLTASVPVATLAEAGRAVALLPGFGCEPSRCALLRRLLLGEVRERAAADRGPEALAGLLYGFGDLLSESERAAIEQQLRRWKPARLVPDFTTVHHLAWGIEPGCIGFTRLQGELRWLAVVPAPATIGAQSSLCLSLAASHAAFGLGSMRQRTAGE